MKDWNARQTRAIGNPTNTARNNHVYVRRLQDPNASEFPVTENLGP